MIRFLYADALAAHPALARGMFRDRAAQFRDRLGWAVAVDPTGQERDAYDALRPLYVIWQDAAGRHGGSLRLLPSTGRTMVNEHFLHLTGGVSIRDPLIWECSRFCLSEGTGAHVSAALMLGALEFGLASGLAHSVGVFDNRMVRVYRRLGWPPTILGAVGHGRNAVAAGLWDFEASMRYGFCQRARVSAAEVAGWLADDLGATWRPDAAPLRLAARA